MEGSSGACSKVPPGFRFHPTDEELVDYYLKKKIESQHIDLDVIREIDLYKIEPWDLQEKCRIGSTDQDEWYFFSHKDKKYPTGTRTNRATTAGFWKATGRDKAIYSKHKLVGMRKTLVFYRGRAPNGQKTDWIMHEYRLEQSTSTSFIDQSTSPSSTSYSHLLQHQQSSSEEGWAVCRVFKKRSPNFMKAAGYPMQMHSDHHLQHDHNHAPANYSTNPSGVSDGSCSFVDAFFNTGNNINTMQHPDNNLSVESAAQYGSSTTYHHPGHNMYGNITAYGQNLVMPAMDGFRHLQAFNGNNYNNNNNNNNNIAASSSSSCKEERIDHYGDYAHQPFMHLPQLESPKLPSTANPNLHCSTRALFNFNLASSSSTTSPASAIAMAQKLQSQTHYAGNLKQLLEQWRPQRSPSDTIMQQHNANFMNNGSSTDWRVLDRLVASQLSHEHPAVSANPNNSSNEDLQLINNEEETEHNPNPNPNNDADEQADDTSANDFINNNAANNDIDLWSFARNELQSTSSDDHHDPIYS